MKENCENNSGMNYKNEYCKSCREAVEVKAVDSWDQSQMGMMMPENQNQMMVSVQVGPYMDTKGCDQMMTNPMQTRDSLAATNYLSGVDSMVTNGSLAAGGSECNDCVIRMVGLAQAYVPMQTSLDLLTPEASLCKGTAFGNLVNHYRKGTGLKA